MEPVPGASVALLPGNISLTATSDSAGHFRIAGIPVGHYTLRVAALGYDTLEVPELWLRVGKYNVQRLELSALAGELGSVTVSAMARERLSPLGTYPLTVDQSLRWAATFFDPARMAGALPGVATTNDEANHLSIRGNSPNANAWLLEGVEIVNPNHTGNAGTATDLPTLSGGGTLLLSAQMLGNTQLHTGVLPMRYDNALGGVLDMNLRRGNADHQEWTVQAGLLGIDLSTEGPLGKRGRSSYLANYRYSTVGLLGKMGVDFGGEEISYQDLSFHVALPVGQRGELRVFGLGGNSSNIFTAEHDSSQWEVDKDGRNIEYRSQMGAIGARLRLPVGKWGGFSGAVAVSEHDQVRTEERLGREYDVAWRERAVLNERKIAGTVQLDGALTARLRYALGLNATERRLYTPLSSDTSAWLIRPWVHGRWILTERLELGLGLGLAHFTFTGGSIAEPRGQLTWRMRRGRKLAFTAGLHSQVPPWQTFAVKGASWYRQAPIGLTRSRDLVIGYDHPIRERLVIHVEAYHQHLTHVPVTAPFFLQLFPEDAISTVNIWNEQAAVPFSATGTATNTGMEASVDHRFTKGFFYRANASWFKSRYAMEGAPDGDTRWNTNYIANLFGGKEFRKEKEDRVRTWGVSARVYAMGGLRERAISPRLSAEWGTTQYAGANWNEQLAPFRRLDLRIYLRKDRKAHTGIWALDLQNATNHKNEAFRYWDSRLGEVVTKHQLGLIPNLSYRVEF